MIKIIISLIVTLIIISCATKPKENLTLGLVCIDNKLYYDYGYKITKIENTCKELYEK